MQSTTPSSIAASWTSWAVTSIADKLIKSSSKSSTNQTSNENTNLSSSEKNGIPLSIHQSLLLFCFTEM